MTIHYHGTPITPVKKIHALAGRHFCVSHAESRNAEICHQIGQSVMLDNGAFSKWTKGKATNWNGYYGWTEKWLAYPTTWAVIPDVIDGSEEENDVLLDCWPHGKNQAAPVWHLDESIERLHRLIDSGYTKICVGSSGQYKQVGSVLWHTKMIKAMNAICVNDQVPVWLHMLRGLSLSGSQYPFSSLDSTDIARHHNERNTSLSAQAERWDRVQCSPYWEYQMEQADLL